MTAQTLTSLTAVVVAALAMAGTLYSARSAARTARRTAEITAQGQLTDDQREELQRFSAELREERESARLARGELDQARYRLRVLLDYLDACLAELRRAGIRPPPMPAAARAPWESAWDDPRT